MVQGHLDRTKRAVQHQRLRGKGQGLKEFKMSFKQTFEFEYLSQVNSVHLFIHQITPCSLVSITMWGNRVKNTIMILERIIMNHLHRPWVLKEMQPSLLSHTHVLWRTLTFLKHEHFYKSFPLLQKIFVTSCTHTMWDSKVCGDVRRKNV